jgi:hypothetical protein
MGNWRNGIMVKRFTLALAVLAVVAFAGCTPSRENGEGSGSKADSSDMGERDTPRDITSPEGVPRVKPSDIYERVRKGESLLVCAYDDNRFENFKLEGAIPVSRLDEALKTRDKNVEIIFYCA